MARTICALAATLTIFATSADAFAADHYVAKTGSDGNTPCDSPVMPCNTIGTAVAESVDGDTIHVGPGTYTQSVSTQDQLNFVGAGSGSDPTSNTIVAPAASVFALRLLDGGSVTGMRLVGGSSSGAAGSGLILQAQSSGASLTYAVSDVTAIGGVLFSGTNPPGIELSDSGATGAQIAATLDNVTATANGAPPAIVAISGTNVGATWTDSTIDGTYNAGGMRVSAGASAVFSRSRTLSHELAGVMSGIGIAATGVGSEITIDRSTVVAALPALSVSNGATGLVRDSLLAQLRTINYLSDNAALFVSTNNGATSHVDISGSTIVSHGPNSDAAMRVQTAPAGGHPSVTLKNSVLRNVDTIADGASSDIYVRATFAGSTATVTADHSAFSTIISEGVGTATSADTAGNVSGDPLFTDPAADFRLQAASALVDRGDPANVTPGEIDLLGNPRSLDSNQDCVVAPDLGAYEITGNELATCPPAPDPGSGGDPGTGTPGSGAGAGDGAGSATGPGPGAVDAVAPLIGKATFTPRRFAVAKRSTPLAARVRRGSSLRFTLNERADVTIVVQRRVGKRWRKAATLVRTGMGPGRAKVVFTGRIGRRTLKPGSYRAVVTAKDQAGNRSKPMSTAFAIIRA